MPNSTNRYLLRHSRVICQVERTKEVLRMISVTVRGWVEEGVISETTIYSWCVLNEPAGWEVRTRTCFKLRTILFLERDLGSLQGQLLPGKLSCYQRAVAAGENVFRNVCSLFFVYRRGWFSKWFFFVCSQTTNVNIQQAFRAGSEFDNLMVAPEFENVSVKVKL